MGSYPRSTYRSGPHGHGAALDGPPKSIRVPAFLVDRVDALAARLERNWNGWCCTSDLPTRLEQRLAALARQAGRRVQSESGRRRPSRASMLRVALEWGLDAIDAELEAARGARCSTCDAEVGDAADGDAGA